MIYKVGDRVRREKNYAKAHGFDMRPGTVIRLYDSACSVQWSGYISNIGTDNLFPLDPLTIEGALGDI